MSTGLSSTLRSNVGRVTFGLVVGAALGACGGSSLTRGAEHYEERRYIDAAQVFEHTEPLLSEYDALERAKYAVYRGATFLALGDQQSARRWLAYGADVMELLPAREKQLLERGLRSLGVSPPAGRALMQGARPLAEPAPVLGQHAAQ